MDLIERQAAIDAVIRHLQLDYEYAWGVREAINALPYAQPEPKTGVWIPDGQKQKHGYEWMHCSVCGFSDIDNPATHTNFCPNCGARMEGEDDG